MTQGFGGEVPTRHVHTEHREVTKFLAVIAAPEGPIAKLLSANRKQIAELDANTEEVTAMILGLEPTVGASGSEWDGLFAGYSVDIRATAKLYTLEA